MCRSNVQIALYCFRGNETFVAHRVEELKRSDLVSEILHMDRLGDASSTYHFPSDDRLVRSRARTEVIDVESEH